MRKSLSLVLVTVLALSTLSAGELLSDKKSDTEQIRVNRNFPPPVLRNSILPAASSSEGAEYVREDLSLEKIAIANQIERLKSEGSLIPQELIDAVSRVDRSEGQLDQNRERQGGDTIEEAEPVTLGTTVTGTTVGYTDDYDEECPYTGSTSPDVVYLLTLTEETSAILDLCDADYDSKLYVYDEDMNLLGCSDDDCGVQSMLILSIPAGDSYIIVDGYSGNEGSYTLVLTEFTASDGDLCSDPFLIDQLPFSGSGTNTDNTDSYGYGSPDEWFALELVESGNVFITLCGPDTDFDTYLYLLTDDCATLIGSDDDGSLCEEDSAPYEPSELLEFLTTGDYRICVEGLGTSVGDYNIEVTFEPFEPGQGDFCEDPWIVDGFPYTISETTTDNIDIFGHESPDEWYSFEVLEEGLVTISLCEGTTFNSFVHLLQDDCATIIATDDYGCGDYGDPSFMVEYLQPASYLICVEGSWTESGDYTLELDFEPFTPGVGDYCDDPHLVAELPFEVDATNLDNIDTYGNDSADEWYSFDVLEEGLVTISLCEGTTFNSYIHLLADNCATVLFTDDYGCGVYGDPSYMMRLFQPGTYLLCVEAVWGVTGGDYNLTIEWEEFNPPPGEFCASAIQIPYLPFEAVETTADNLDTWGGPSQDEWYQFSLPVAGNVVISLCDGGTTFDSYLWLLGDDCVTELASNDDSCGLQSEMIVDLNPGTYVICVEGYSSNSGDYSLAVTTDAPGDGNDCNFPFTIDGFPFSDEWWTFGYGDTGFEPSPDVYYEFLLEDGGVYTFTTCMEETYDNYFDTRLLILAEDCETVVHVSEDDCDGAYDGWSTITADLAQGLYYLVIEGSGDALGNYQLECYFDGVCDPPECPNWGIDEVEPNDGSNGNPPSYDSIAPGETHCGNTWSSNYTRDSDWYQFEVDAGTDVEFYLDGEEEHSLVLYLIDESSGSPQIVATGVAGACADHSFSHTIATAGTYSAYVAYDDFYASGPSSEYTLTWGDLMEVDGQTAVPEQFFLAQNYPNPFNPETTIEFSLPLPSQVELAVYDITGRKVALLVDGVRSAGNHAIQFDAALMPSGLYFYRLTASGESFTRKMVLVK